MRELVQPGVPPFAVKIIGPERKQKTAFVSMGGFLFSKLLTCPYIPQEEKKPLGVHLTSLFTPDVFEGGVRRSS